MDGHKSVRAGQYLSELDIDRIAGDGTVFVAVAGVTDELCVPDAEISLARLPVTENGGR